MFLENIRNIIQVCMDRNSPEYYKEETRESLAETEIFINKVHFYKHLIETRIFR